MSPPPPRLPALVIAVLERLVPERAARDGLLGDLEERYGRLLGSGPGHRAVWLTMESAGAVFHYARERSRRGRESREGRVGMDAFRQDFRFAMRNVLRRPSFSLLVVLTLGLAIGANAAMFSVVKGLLLEALPFEEPERLVIIDQRNDEGFTASVSFPNYRDWKARTRALDPVSVLLPGSTPLATGDGALMIESAWVHGGFFETLGVEAEVGRVFTAEESEPGAAPVVVLGHDVWRSVFGADPTVVGASITLREEAFTVVGVMPATFRPHPDTEVYLPLGRAVDRVPWDDRGTGAGAVVYARLAPISSVDDARADLTAIVEDLRAEFGEDAYWANIVPLREWYLGDTVRQTWLMMAAVLLMLLVSCVNVANLLMVRGEARRGEIAVRIALGAGRRRVHHQLLTESLVYGTLGGVVGLIVARVGLDGLLAVVGDTLPAGMAPRIEIDQGVLAFTAGVALLSAVLAGFVPAIRSSRASIADTMRDSGSVLRRGARARRILMGAEVALSMVLLVGAALVLSSLGNLRAVDKGYDGSDVLTARVSLAGAGGYETRESWSRFHERLREEVAALPGVLATATSNHFPLSGNSWEMLFRDERTPAGDRGTSVLLTMVSPEYFETYGVEIVEGRAFTEADRWGTEDVTIVDETLAASRWPGERAVGKMVSFEQLPNEEGEYVIDVWRRVVGVARHVRHYELASPSRIEVYTPLDQSAAWGFTGYLSVRAATDPAALVPAVRRVLVELEPDAAAYRIRTMEAVVAEELGTHRALGELLGVFAAVTLLLGTIGIYAVVSHASATRVREVGLRMALGGAPRSMVALIVRDALGPIGVGILVGAVTAVAAAGVLGSLLYGVAPADPGILTASALVLLAVGTLSAWLPARAAARVHPAEALRPD